MNAAQQEVHEHAQNKHLCTTHYFQVPEISSPLSKIVPRILACTKFSAQNPHQKCVHVRILVGILGQWT